MPTLSRPIVMYPITSQEGDFWKYIHNYTGQILVVVYNHQNSTVVIFKGKDPGMIHA